MVVTDARIRVTGARELRKALRDAPDEFTAQLKLAYRSSGAIVTTRARSEAPVDTGDLRDSVRTLGGKTKAVVAAGKGKTKDYAGRIHFGDPNPGIEANPFIHEALEREWDRVYAYFEEAVDAVVATVTTNRFGR